MSATAQVGPGEAPLVEAPAQRDRGVTEHAILFLVILALMSIGVLMVYSASRKAFAAPDGLSFLKHMIFVPLAVGAMVAGAMVPYRRLNRRWVALSVLGATLVLLALVLVLGEERGGARRWFSFPIGSFKLSLQPSEFAKFAMIIFLAWFFSQPQGDPQHTASRWRFLGWFYRLIQSRPRSFWRGFVPAVLVMGLVGVLIVKEDFGTGALVGLVAMLVCLIAGWKWWFPLLMILPGIAGFYKFVWLVDYRHTRLDVWFDPWQHFDGAGWHVCQSLMGIGSGGLSGAGFGAGIQKLYIPENTTDFIFAVVCEEMGILGGLLVIGLFGVFLWRAGRIVQRAPDRFGFLLAAGILLTIGLQAIMNIGVVTGALPAKGISLPFISYGGSGLVMMSFAAGLLLAVSRAGEAAVLAKSSQPLVYAPSPIRVITQSPVPASEASGAEREIGGMPDTPAAETAPKADSTSAQEPTTHA